MTFFRCDYIRLREPPYLSGRGKTVCSTKNMSGTNITVFTTLTRDATLDFFHSKPHDLAFIIRVESKSNLLHNYTLVSHHTKLYFFIY